MHYFSPWDRGRLPKKHWRRDAAHPPGGRLHLALFGAKQAAAEMMRQSGLTKTEADDLLDWLEANGCRHYEILSTTDQTFAVRWWN